MPARAGGLSTRLKRWWERVGTVQGITTAAVLIGCGALVLYPVLFLIQESFNIGDPIVFPAEQYGFDNYLDLVHDLGVMRNTVVVAGLATVMAVFFGFVLAWILSRTDVPGRGLLERLMELPYYVTPLVGALAWSVLAGPKNGFLNQLWRLPGGQGDLFNVQSAFGIAWVMAFFEGTVAFMMISAAMKSMDPALEESSRVLGVASSGPWCGSRCPWSRPPSWAPPSSCSPRCSAPSLRPSSWAFPPGTTSSPRRSTSRPFPIRPTTPRRRPWGWRSSG